MADRTGVLAQKWQPSFRHSAGRIGSHFIRAIRDRKQLLGWKTERLGVTIPPIEAGSTGEWVEIGPGATLVGYASPSDLSEQDIEPGKVFAAIKVDGADTVLYALVECKDPSILSIGTRLEAVFADVSASVLPAFRPIAVSA